MIWLNLHPDPSSKYIHKNELRDRKPMDGEWCVFYMQLVAKTKNELRALNVNRNMYCWCSHRLFAEIKFRTVRGRHRVAIDRWLSSNLNWKWIFAYFCFEWINQFDDCNWGSSWCCCAICPFKILISRLAIAIKMLSIFD